MIGCPKPDEGDYTEKLTEVISNKDIRDVTIARMEMPCCVGLWCSDDSYSVGTLFYVLMVLRESLVQVPYAHKLAMPEY